MPIFLKQLLKVYIKCNLPFPWRLLVVMCTIWWTELNYSPFFKGSFQVLVVCICCSLLRNTRSLSWLSYSYLVFKYLHISSSEDGPLLPYLKLVSSTSILSELLLTWVTWILVYLPVFLRPLTPWRQGL